MASIWMFRWLLFRLIFGSGLVKLASGDPTWRNLTALSYHYETQPIPNPIAWYMYQLPLGFHKAETLITLIVELLIPFTIFMPRIVRFVGAAVIAGLQFVILITGNYAFFNCLTIFMCILLLDDHLLYHVVQPNWTWLRGGIPRAFPSRIWEWTVYTISLILLFMSLFVLPVRIGLMRYVPRPVLSAMRVTAPFYMVNGYGLFAIMTTERPEIIIQGSNDGQTWKDYEFKYKPGDLHRPPPFVAPHQPRLDWQMWFAALEGPPSPRWFRNLLIHLLDGSPEVLALFKTNPFPDHPPRFVRALVYDYEFTDFATRQSTGQWWQRGQPSPYNLDNSDATTGDRVVPSP